MSLALHFANIYSYICKSRVEISHRLMKIFLILKRLGGQFDPSCVFFKESAKEIVNSWFFVTFDFLTFNIIIIHIIIGIPQVVQKIWRLSLTILAIFISFYQFFGFFDISLWQRNWWRQLITDDASIFFIFDIL